MPIYDPISQLSLPPGFRFYPTDEELLVQYLCRKVAGHHFSLQIIGDIDLYKFDPWVLPSKFSTPLYTPRIYLFLFIFNLKPRFDGAEWISLALG